MDPRGRVYFGDLTVARPTDTLVVDTVTGSLQRSTNGSAAAYAWIGGTLLDNEAFPIGTSIDVNISAIGGNALIEQGAGGGSWVFVDSLTVAWGTGLDVLFDTDGTDLNIGQGAGAGDLTFLDSLPVNFGTGKDLIITADGTNVVFSNTGASVALWHDDVMVFADPADTTRRMRIDVGAVSAATTRVITQPDSDVLLASVSRIIADVGTGVAIPVTTSLAMPITSAAAETNTLAIPTFLGQRMFLTMDVQAVGARVVTVATDINVGGDNIMTFGAVRDTIELVAIQLAGALAWEVAWNNNVALS